MTGHVLPRNVAVLGGGIGALAAVFALTSSPGWQRHFSITVYQLGWRLGGKGASSRNARERCRNEEHGLHVLGGYYHNVFRMLRECYAEWQAPAGALTFDEAFFPVERFWLEEQVAGDWRDIEIEMPANDKQPGAGATELTVRDACERLLRNIECLLERANLRGFAPALLADAAPLVQGALAVLPPENDLALWWSGLPDGVAESLARMVEPLRDILLLLEQRWSPRGNEPNPFALAAIASIYVIGLLRDCRSPSDCESLNEIELMTWARRHGATDSILGSPYVRSGYDYAFAYLDGDAIAEKRCIAAGVAIRASLKMLFTYHGALFWHMAAGMGEVVFVPLFEVLKRRGVKFEFFRRVERLIPDATGMLLDLVEGTRQSETESYEPLVDGPVGRCYPDTPIYDRLPDGDTLAGEGDDLESWWAPRRDRKPFSLRRGEDFDEVILGIPVGVLHEIAMPLAAVNHAWSEMLSQSAVIATAHVQLWSPYTSAELGRGDPAGLVTTYAQPLNTWADMSFLARHEAPSPRGRLPHISYFCGPLGRAVTSPPGPEYPSKEAGRVQRAFIHWLQNNVAHLLPLAFDENGNALQDLVGDTYTRANVNLTDLYVQSLPGTIKFRLAPGASGFDNLFLAGDWTRNGLDAGAVEAAVMSGLQCAAGLQARYLGEAVDGEVRGSLPITGTNSFL